MQYSNKKSVAMQKVVIPNEILIPHIVKQINDGHTVTLPLKGFSMRPFLEDGRDKALLTKVQNPKVGDPVLAEVNTHRYVLHRIIKIDGRHITLLGDGNLCPEYCRMENIQASVIGFYRKGRTTLDYIDGTKWKVYSRIWMFLRPLRRWLLTFYRRIWIPCFGAI